MPTPLELGLQVSSWRKGQWEAIYRAHTSPKRFVAHNAPTGSGKSIMLVGHHLLSRQRALILTGTKALQDQYTKEFSYLNPIDVRGKSNYSCRATELGGEFYDHSPAKSVDMGPCQFGVECGLKQNGCTYYDRIRQAMTAKLVISNYAAWIAANLYGDGWGHFPLIMGDEIHEAEGWLAKMLAVHLPHTYSAAMGVTFPLHDDPVKWQEWAVEWQPRIKHQLVEAAEASRSRRGAVRHTARVKALQLIEQTLTRMKNVGKDWAVLRQRDNILFHPIWVRRYTESNIFCGAAKVVLASATVRPHTLNVLGIKTGDSEFLEHPSTFPASRRPIYFYPIVRMKHGMDEEEHPKWINVVDKFISQRLDRKGIVHTVSYARATHLSKDSHFSFAMVTAPTPSHSYAGGQKNTRSSLTPSLLQRHRMNPAPSILVHPSMATGINLAYKDAEYTIIPKMPFESMTDPMLVLRSKEEPEYGIYQCAQTLVQAIGRAMRAEDDLNECLITDAVFGMFMGRYRSMIPKWIWDAVVVVDKLPFPLPTLEIKGHK